MLRLGIIRRSCSDWASPLHVVPKGEGSFRPCGDFRHLNACTIPDKYPVPHLQDFCRDLKGKRVFSKIDLTRAFHQIPLSKEAIPKTAITTPFGLFEFIRMPFGLCNAAQTFQRCMDNILKNMPGVFKYIDDILVSTVTEEEHEKLLRKLFAKLSQFGLIVNAAKSTLGSREVNFLGFTINSCGVKPMAGKIKAITEYPVPQTYNELSQFLGMVNFYHRFIPNCSQLAKPLYDVLKKNSIKKKSIKPILAKDWTENQSKAFQALKIALAEETSLAYPAHDTETRLVTDASETAAGAALEQKTDGCWKPLGFFSKMFHSPELQYSAYDRELLAIKLAIQHFHYIIEGIPSELFHVATDHKPLTTGSNFKSMESKTQLSRVTRTWQFISEFTTDIRHLSGDNNVVADTFSRNAVYLTDNQCLIESISKEQEKIHMRPTENVHWPSHWAVQKHMGYNITVDTRGKTPRPVIPESLQRKVFDTIHSLGHLGVKATQKTISSSYVWPNMSKDIAAWISTCMPCQKAKIMRHNHSPFQKLPSSSGKFQDVHVDIVGPLPISSGYSYILTCVDRFSRWPAAIPMKGISAKECATSFIQGWMQYYGTPVNLVTDRGRQFISSLWQELCHIMGTTHNMTTAYHPQSNGMVERFHRQMKACLIAKADGNVQWYDDLPMIMLAIRTAVKEDLGVSSADMVYGESIRIPAGFFPCNDEKKWQDSKEYTKLLQEHMAKAAFLEPQWHGNDIKSQSLKDLQSCSHVFVLQIAKVKSALQPPYVGPFEVIDRKDKVFTIKLNDGSLDTVSIDRLKPAYIISTKNL